MGGEKAGTADLPMLYASPPVKLYQIDAKLSFTEPDAGVPDASVPCDNCPAPCCTTANWTVFLTYTEAQRLPYTFARVKFPGGQEVEFAAVLPRHPITGACVFAVDGRCTVWAIRPAACRTYDCRKDPALAAFAKVRFGT